MFLKQYSYKPRSNSQSSTGSQGASGQVAGSPPKDTMTAAAATTSGGPVSAAAAGRRRSSAAGAEKFAGLSGYKRSSQDAAAGDRKASWAEQKPGGGGLLSNAWNSFTKGS